MENARSKQFVRFKLRPVPRGVVKPRAVPLCLAQDMIRPFVPRAHALHAICPPVTL